MVPQDRKNFSHIDQNEETQKYHIRTRNTKIPYHKNFKPGSLKRNFMQLPKLNLLWKIRQDYPLLCYKVRLYLFLDSLHWSMPCKMDVFKRSYNNRFWRVNFTFSNSFFVCFQIYGRIAKVTSLMVIRSTCFNVCRRIFRQPAALLTYCTSITSLDTAQKPIKSPIVFLCKNLYDKNSVLGVLVLLLIKKLAF